MRVRLKGINTIRKRLADGTVVVYRYHRATGHRLEGAPGSPQFLACIAEAEALMRDRLAGTFSGIVRDYLTSTEFRDTIAKSTQAEYRRMLGKAEAEFGDMPTVALNDPRVADDFLNWRDRVVEESGPREGDNRLSAVSAMLTWATGKRKVAANHLAGFQRLYAANRADLIWQPEDVEAFMRAAPVELQRALIIGLHTGQRQGDILRLTWANYDGRSLRLRQSKSKRHGKIAPIVTIPCTTALRRMLDSMDRTGLAILTTRTGRPWKKRYFARQWELATKAAGIEALHFHDLRGTAITMLAEAGCTTPEIASITGHAMKTVDTILEKYLSRTQALAEMAMSRFENAERTQFANRLQTGPSTGTKGSVK